MKILVVDDEEDVVNLISIKLRQEGYQVIPAYNGEDAIILTKMERPDLIILDVMLPGIEGLEVCKHIRARPQYSNIPIIMLSAKTSEIDRILGLEMGANDYITKPFSVRELISRIRVWLRRKHEPQNNVGNEQAIFSHKDLYVNFERYEVAVKGKKIVLTPKEIKLLFFFVKNPGRVYTREQLIDLIWGETFVTPRSVDVYVSHLRKFIEPDPKKPTYIVTVSSIGYKFDDSNP
jgi:two-component system, OmpR family, alkaline phosphatase synthesis response regulator PhoP